MLKQVKRSAQELIQIDLEFNEALGRFMALTPRSCGKEQEKTTHSIEHILTMEVKREVSSCRPREPPPFIEATICTPSSPTHSLFRS